MSFLEKAKLAATGLAAKADEALTNAGMNPGGASVNAGSAGSSRDADRLLRDLGVLTLREANGEPSPDAKQRVIGALRQLQAAGQLSSLMTSDQAPPPNAPPPPPGFAASQAANQVGISQLPPPPASASFADLAPAPEAQAAPAPPAPPPTATVAPPPPPSWASS